MSEKEKSKRVDDDDGFKKEMTPPADPNII